MMKKIVQHLLRRWWLWALVGLLAAGSLSIFLFNGYQEHGITLGFISKRSIVIPKDKITKAVLKNGMTVLVFEKKMQPKVLLQVAYDIGASAERGGEKGLAHLIEHMIFKGTEKLSEGDIDAIARKYGATFNAFTSYDATSYLFEVNKNNWKPFVPLLADCMQNARFEKEHLASEMKAVIQELRMGADSPGRIMFHKACELLYPSNHPYHTPIIGFKEDLAGLSSKRLQKFYSKYYHPNRATLFVVGDIEAQDAIAEAEKYFGALPAQKGAPTLPFPAINPPLVRSRVQIYREMAQPTVGLFWRIPGLADPKSLATARMLAEVLGGGEGSRLARRLIDEEKIATSVSAGLIELTHEGLFLISFDPKPGKVDVCRRSIEAELTQLVSGGVRAAELSKIAKTEMRAFYSLMENNQKFTMNWLTSYLATKDEFDVFTSINRLGEVASRDVVAFAKKYLDILQVAEVQLLAAPSEYKQKLAEERAYDDAIIADILKHHVRTAPLEEPKFVQTLLDPKPIDLSFPKPTSTYMLPNGLKVLLLPQHDMPTISLGLRFKDSALLSHARDGIQLEVMMAMLTEQSEGYRKKDLIDLFERYGAAYSYGASGASMVVMKEDFSAVFKHLMHVLLHPEFREENLQKLKSIGIINYENARLDQGAVATRILFNVCYPNHPFYWSFEDAIELLKETDLAILEQLHKRFINPAGMVLAVVGDFDEQSLRKSIAAATKQWQATPYEPMRLAETIEKTRAKNIDYYMLRDQATLLLGRPSPITVYDPDLVPLQLLNLASFASLGSRLYAIREQTGLFYTANGSWAAEPSKAHGYDMVSALVNVGNLAKAEEAIRGFVATIGAEGILQSEFNDARALFIKHLIDRYCSHSQIAAQFCGLDSLELGFDFYENMLLRVQSMSLDEVNSIAKKYFNTENMSRIRIGRVGVRR